MTRRIALLPLLLALVLAAGCASPMSTESRSEGPRVRCLDESPRSPEPRPGITTRPLFFLFCIQSP